MNGARLFVIFIPGQAHGHAHPEELRGFNAALIDVEQVAIKDRLNAQVLKVFIAFGFLRPQIDAPDHNRAVWDLNGRFQCPFQ